LERKSFNFKEHAKWVDSTALVMQVGLTMAGSILFCLAIGYYLDKWLGTRPLFIIIFILLGIVGGGVTVYRQIMQATEQDGKKDARDGKPT
jgi:ATP synthase protein I